MNFHKSKSDFKKIEKGIDKRKGSQEDSPFE